MHRSYYTFCCCKISTFNFNINRILLLFNWRTFCCDDYVVHDCLRCLQDIMCKRPNSMWFDGQLLLFIHISHTTKFQEALRTSEPGFIGIDHSYIENGPNLPSTLNAEVVCAVRVSSRFINVYWTFFAAPTMFAFITVNLLILCPAFNLKLIKTKHPIDRVSVSSVDGRNVPFSLPLSMRFIRFCRTD